MNNQEDQADLKQAGIKKRSLFCWIILSMALTYFMILALLFLAGSVFSGRIIEIISPYYGTENPLPPQFLSFTLGGAALYFIASSGIILFMTKRRAGFYIFFAATLIIFSLDLTFMTFDWLRYLILTGFIFILGIAHFSKRCYS
jgi:hypothetical protein